MQPQMIPVLTSARHHKAGRRLGNVEMEKGGGMRSYRIGLSRR
jgi:hypothetical protein